MENKAKKSSIVVHPYQEGEDLLTDAEYRAAAKLAHETKEDVHGFKGLSFLFILQYMSYQLALDYLHTVCIGITAKLLDLWFSTDHKGKSYNFSQRLSEVDREMKKIKPPAFIPRAPRGVSNRNRWKGSFLTFKGRIGKGGSKNTFPLLFLF